MTLNLKDIFLERDLVKKLIKKVLELDLFTSKPPVLVDIGASGEIFGIWRSLAPYAVCIAFDADLREFKISEDRKSGWKRLYLLNRLVGDAEKNKSPFYLTNSPYCSSILHPDANALNEYAFNGLFEVSNMVEMPMVTLQSALGSVNVDYIDWYKSDSQGTDLRIFSSLSDAIQKKILAADFEPGVIDSYQGEDKLWQVLRQMEALPFWISSMVMHGSHRINPEGLSLIGAYQKKHLRNFLKMAPACCEISYLNNLSLEGFTKREFYLGWVFSTIKKEHGFALKIALDGHSLFGDSLFLELRDYSIGALSGWRGYLMSVLRLLMQCAKRIPGI